MLFGVKETRFLLTGSVSPVRGPIRPAKNLVGKKRQWSGTQKQLRPTLKLYPLLCVRELKLLSLLSATGEQVKERKSTVLLVRVVGGGTA
mmetsp:Transcript_65152/g.122026  ORF Transcript_65152/g.122026 Transcript_65152/m.122026 type:complete len:90 (-) Transcript_65152:347-616(-)